MKSNAIYTLVKKRRSSASVLASVLLSVAALAVLLLRCAGQRHSTRVLNTSYTITANIDVPQGGAEGMIVTDGGRFGGYALNLLKGTPTFVLDLKRVK